MVAAAEQDAVFEPVVPALAARGDVVDLQRSFAAVLGDQPLETDAIPLPNRVIKLWVDDPFPASER